MDWGQSLGQDNGRIWHMHYKPKQAHDHIANWQAYLEYYRQVVVKVQEIAEETGWRGPEAAVRLKWERRDENMI